MILAAILKLSPAVRWALGAIAAIVLLAALWLTITSREEADDTRNIERGKVEQREADQAETLERIERANHAEDQVRTDDAARRASCLRHSRTPENCR